MNLYKEVLDILRELEISALELDVNRSNEIWDSIDNKYAGGSKKAFLWDGFACDYICSSHENSWKWIGNFVGDSRTVLMFLEYQKVRAFLFEKGIDIVEVIGETRSSLDIYITNEIYDYLLSYSHHDVLCACGTAKKWLQDYEEKLRCE